MSKNQWQWVFVVSAGVALGMMLGAGLWASDVQWTRFRGQVKAVNYKTATLTLESNGDLVTVKIDDDVTILRGKEAIDKISGVLIDDKVTLIYAPKAPASKDPDEPPPGGVYAPERR